MLNLQEIESSIKNTINPLSISSFEIDKIAANFSDRMQVKNNEDIIKLISMIGGDINHFTNEITYKNNNEENVLLGHLSISKYYSNKFIINILNTLTIENKNIIIGTLLGNYVLHTQCGKHKTDIYFLENDLLCKEGLQFYLSLFINNDEFLNLIQNYSLENISKNKNIELSYLKYKKELLKNFL